MSITNLCNSHCVPDQEYANDLIVGKLCLIFLYMKPPNQNQEAWVHNVSLSVAKSKFLSPSTQALSVREPAKLHTKR